MPNNEEKKLYLVKGNNKLYHPRLLTKNNANKKQEIYKTVNGNPYELKKIKNKANEIFKKLQFKIKQANSENNEWQNININNLNELNELKIKVNGKNFYLKNIFPNISPLQKKKIGQKFTALENNKKLIENVYKLSSNLNNILINSPLQRHTKLIIPNISKNLVQETIPSRNPILLEEKKLRKPLKKSMKDPLRLIIPFDRKK
jgi:hypothetical protein